MMYTKGDVVWCMSDLRYVFTPDQCIVLLSHDTADDSAPSESNILVRKLGLESLIHTSLLYPTRISAAEGARVRAVRLRSHEREQHEAQIVALRATIELTTKILRLSRVRQRSQGC